MVLTDWWCCWLSDWLMVLFCWLTVVVVDWLMLLTDWWCCCWLSDWLMVLLLLTDCWCCCWLTSWCCWLTDGVDVIVVNWLKVTLYKDNTHAGPSSITITLSLPASGTSSSEVTLCVCHHDLLICVGTCICMHVCECSSVYVCDLDLVFRIGS